MLTILVDVANWEREIMLTRHGEAIAKAKAGAKYNGCPGHIDAAEIKPLSAHPGPTAISSQRGSAYGTVHRLRGQELARE